MTVDEESRDHLLSAVTLAVRSGFGTETEVIEDIEQLVEDELGDSDPKLVRELQAEARRLLAAQHDEELTWTGRSTNDAIERAFEELTENGVVALENAGYTQSDGWSDANEAAEDRDPPPRGAVFYHGQDVERGVAGEGLYLTFGAYADDEEASLAIAREVCDTLASHGVETSWDGNVGTRILIPPFPWRRRRQAGG
jgi:Domain of unknown function (DUF6891)